MNGDAFGCVLLLFTIKGVDLRMHNSSHVGSLLLPRDLDADFSVSTVSAACVDFEEKKRRQNRVQLYGPEYCSVFDRTSGQWLLMTDCF